MRFFPADDSVISAMASELRGLRNYDIKGIAIFALQKAGFESADIERFVMSAITCERRRRQSFPNSIVAVVRTVEELDKGAAQ